MDLFDKVKEKTTSALEQGKGLAHTQQLKLHLRKLDCEIEDASGGVRRGGVRRSGRPARSR